MRFRAYRGSHLPALIKVVGMTTGPILELGCGYNSTPFLHWACYPTKRTILTCENNADYFEFATGYTTDFHAVRCVTDWDAVDLSGPWSVAFVDHSPEPRRAVDVARLLHAEYVVVHDTDNRNEQKTHWSLGTRLFKWHYKYVGARPHTSILSNVHDLREFTIP
jgi:hypothetical protein